MEINKLKERLKLTLIEQKGLLLLSALMLIIVVSARALRHSTEDEEPPTTEEILKHPTDADHNQRRTRLIDIYTPLID